MTKTKKSAGFESVKLCCHVLDEKKADEIKVFDVSAQSSITDYLILATATSEPHLRALRVEIEKALDSSGAKIVGMEMAQESGWVVIDVFDLMIHLFLAPVRQHYSLERLWSDATEVPMSRVLGKETPAKASARPGHPAKKPPTKPAKKRTPRKSSS